jgi:hypothetical protein
MSFFSNRYKFLVHILQIILVLSAIGVSVIKLFLFKVPGAPTSRANTMALGIVRPLPSLHLLSPLSPQIKQTKLTNSCRVRNPS